MASPYYNQGEHTYSVPMGLHALNRQRLCEKLREAGVQRKTVLVLRGGEQKTRYNTDMEVPFRQESYFQWTFGVMEPNCWGAIEVDSAKSYMFFPDYEEAEKVWIGLPKSLSYFKAHYGIDKCSYTFDIIDVVNSLKPDLVLTMNGINTDSQLPFDEPVLPDLTCKVDNLTLYPVISECRVIKTSLELDVLRYANKIASEAHKEVMRKIKPGMMEYQMESIFTDYCYMNSGARIAYNCICASGTNASILHYGHAAEPNSKQIKDGDMCVFDMGCEYHCYTSDITCSYPANGKFSKTQKTIYEAVLKSSQSVQAAMKPGVSWVEMHKLADRIHLDALRGIGLVRGDLEGMMKCGLGAVFMPHGLGHFLGIDVHDVGGYTKDGPPRPTEPGMRSLRTARTLEEGMVITVEPGIYFSPFLISEAWKCPEYSPFLTEKLNTYTNFGGVRIEDDIVVTKDGIEVLTQVPRAVDEIEALMAGIKYVPPTPTKGGK